jgi:hypothetical protein
MHATLDNSYQSTAICMTLERIANGEVYVAVILHRPEHTVTVAPEKIGANLGPQVVAERIAQ